MRSRDELIEQDWRLGEHCRLVIVSRVRCSDSPPQPELDERTAAEREYDDHVDNFNEYGW
jgi:hypothetical protein